MTLLCIPLALALWFTQQAAPAPRDTVRDSVLEARVREVASSLRCPVCQNLSIEDSPSELAQDMRRIVRERLAAGETAAEVRRYFVERYGEWVLLEPPARGLNLAVWVLPGLVVLGGGVVVWTLVRRWARPVAAAASAGIPAPPAPPAPGALPADLEPGELEARRTRLRTALAELEADFTDGKVAAADYDQLKRQDEAELAAASAALKTHRKSADAPPRHPAAAAGAGPPPRRLPPAVAWGAGIVLFGAVVAFALTRAVAPRAPGGTITGVDLSGGSGSGADEGGGLGEVAPVDTARLRVLEARVAHDSNDHPALIELGHLYLAQQRLNRSAQVNMRAVRLKPDAPETAEAFAHLGMLLWSSGEMATGLRSLEKALALHPDLPEALLYKGIILFAGARDPSGAAAAWERYLQVAPPGASTERVRAMLQAARAAR